MDYSSTRQQRRGALLLAAALAVVLLASSACRVADAARPAPADDQARPLDHGETAAAVLEKAARETTVVELLMARLPAGPSPKGPGH
ncbi:hypothetical protein BRADI_3g41792v3 [Brachypodium distachyon]|uniref:Uncharacterized protein n=1 Tax=Brachypodium distachyon TaxID=15368 RepID=A0A0Q3QBT4_BRADI|nr:hypothetical protein BRADI_3g41792v3 [Brachypodium distachyon]